MVLRNWAGNVTYSAARLHEPRTIEELQEIVARSSRLRALGTGHSFNRIADSDELVTVRGLPETVDIRADQVVAPGGARYTELVAPLHAAGLALHNLGSLPHISLAGACATGTHGSGDHNGCLPTAVTAVEFVRADGELVTVERSDPDFGGSVLALGALGVVTRMTLAVEPAYDIAQDVWVDAPLRTVLEHYDEITASGYSVSMFSSGSPDRIDQIWIKRRGSQATDGTPWGARPAGHPMHPIAHMDVRAATEQGGIAGPWHERLPHFRASFTPSVGDEQQSEYLVPRTHGPAAIAAVHSLGLGDLLQVAEFRTVAADELWLSPAHGRATTALHFTWRNDADAIAVAVAALERALAPFDPRPHWGKVFATSPQDLQRHYPRLGEFRELLARHDPNRKFGNPFLERYVY
jgi:alditol oxidase